MTENITVNCPREEMLDKSRIYKGAQLTKYQEAINNASYELCLDNQGLLNRKGELLELARKRIHDNGYVYKKRASRSKSFGVSKNEPEPKQQKVSTEFRQKRIKDLSEDIESIKTTITLLEKERYKQHNMKKYAQAASIEEQIGSKRKEKRAFEEELTRLQGKEAKSKRYHQSKTKKENTLAKKSVDMKMEGQLNLFDSGLIGKSKMDVSEERDVSEIVQMAIADEESTASTRDSSKTKQKDTKEKSDETPDSESEDHFL